jgi:pimeloyl-ACP methyl ester carboxylesterase
MTTEGSPRLTRRRLLVTALGAVTVVAVAGATGVELVAHHVLPGAQEFDQLDGACSVLTPALTFSPLDPTHSGIFYSRARRQRVGYTIAYPPDHGPGSELPLVVMLHGYGGNHAHALPGVEPAQAVALRIDGRALAPMAMVTVDGGNGYWNPHPGDNPMGMVMDELIPMCQALGLGRLPQRIGTMGISMGGYGAILLAEKYPETVSAVAAISPAVWTSYRQAHAANAGAYASRSDFTGDDVVTHTAALVGVAVRVASGDDDPFRPGVEALARALPPGAVVHISKGCHSDSFFTAQEAPSLSFLAEHLAP